MLFLSVNIVPVLERPYYGKWGCICLVLKRVADICKLVPACMHPFKRLNRMRYSLKALEKKINETIKAMSLCGLLTNDSEARGQNFSV